MRAEMSITNIQEDQTRRRIQADMIRDLAAAVQRVFPPAASDLRDVAEKLEAAPYNAPMNGKCPFCDPPQGIISVIEFVCPSSQDYAAGYRTIWKCRKCGEMEYR